MNFPSFQSRRLYRAEAVPEGRRTKLTQYNKMEDEDLAIVHSQGMIYEQKLLNEGMVCTVRIGKRMVQRKHPNIFIALAQTALFDKAHGR